MKIKIFIIVCIVAANITTLSAQLAMGKWRTHFAYNSVTQIAQSENKIFALSEGSLFSVDKEDKSTEFYSKMNGLSDNNILRIDYDAKNKQLLIVYVNGNMDLLSSGGVINIPDLYNKQMGTSKTINHILFNGNNAYLSSSFGIMVLNLSKAEISDTYFIGSNGSDVKVLSTAIHEGYIYANSGTTVYRGVLDDPNLVNFEFWSTLTGLPGSGDLIKIADFANKLVLLRGNKLYMQDTNQSWVPLFPDISTTDFSVSNNKMIINSGGTSVYIVDESLKMNTIQSTGTLSDAEFDNNRNLYWLAGNEKGVVSVDATNINNPEIKNYQPLGPATNVPWQIKFSGSKMFVVQGGRWASQYERPGYVMIYENGNWTNLNPSVIKQQTGRDPLDFMNVAVDPSDNNHFFVSSYGTGLYEFKDNAFSKWYTHLNSTLETIVPEDPFNYVRLDGAVYDKVGNLLVVNMNVNAAIKVLMKDGTWKQLTYPHASKPTLGKITISKLNPNQKWIPSIRYDPGLLVYDDNGTIADQSDDKSVYFSAFVYPETDNGQTYNVSVSPAVVFEVVEDKNNVVWVGTDLGPFLFYNTSKVFDTGYTCSRVKIPRNDGTGYADYLLQNEKIKAIAIDGANRKWLGTETSGVYLMSENGQETIKHFTTENSPLLSNDIFTIAIHPTTGEVFFGTGRGIVSYQSDALEGGEEFSNVHAYPNPVREGYSGIITITGLVKDTQIKITDINGNLICQTVSNGGLATWDGKDVHGKKVSTGIYLAIGVNGDGTQSTITKIMVIN